MEIQKLQRISPVYIAWHDTKTCPHFNNNESYGKRTVEHYELEYIVSSRSGYILTDDIPVPTDPGAVFFRIPGMVVEGIGVYRSIYVEFDLNESADRLIGPEDLSYVYQNQKGKAADERLFASFHLEADASASRCLLWKADILRLLSVLLENTEAKEKDDPNMELQLAKIRKALQYVQEHYQEEITVKQLAEQTGYSIYYFCRLFKEITALTPVQYAMRYRLERAKDRLLLSDETAETVMLQSGFHHYGHFWKAFKAVYGSAPGDYRKQHLSEEAIPEDQISASP